MIVKYKGDVLLLELSEKFWDCEFFDYKLEELNLFGFSEETKETLMNCGLPKNHSIFKKKNIDFFEINKFQEVIYKNENYTVIGRALGGFISIHNMTQKLFSLSEDINYKILINSKLKFFLLFHQIFYLELEKVEDISEDEACEKFGKELRKIFEDIDPIAMLDKESTWSRLIEEYENCLI
ncbi:hypothetical protein B9G55_11180 [Saccharibacillus sp. O16]|nr:hypothetical protein B9G55_11180 [Saccharibacillus sp. O16]